MALHCACQRLGPGLQSVGQLAARATLQPLACTRVQREPRHAPDVAAEDHHLGIAGPHQRLAALAHPVLEQAEHLLSWQAEGGRAGQGSRSSPWGAAAAWRAAAAAAAAAATPHLVLQGARDLRAVCVQARHPRIEEGSWVGCDAVPISDLKLNPHRARGGGCGPAGGQAQRVCSLWRLRAGRQARCACRAAGAYRAPIPRACGRGMRRNQRALREAQRPQQLPHACPPPAGLPRRLTQPVGLQPGHVDAQAVPRDQAGGMVVHVLGARVAVSHPAGPRRVGVCLCPLDSASCSAPLTPGQGLRRAARRSGTLQPRTNRPAAASTVHTHARRRSAARRRTRCTTRDQRRRRWQTCATGSAPCSRTTGSPAARLRAARGLRWPGRGVGEGAKRMGHVALRARQRHACRQRDNLACRVPPRAKEACSAAAAHSPCNPPAAWH